MLSLMPLQKFLNNSVLIFYGKLEVFLLKVKTIRAVYMRENKPRPTLAMAYIRRERNHLYKYGLYQMQTARINGSQLSSRPDQSNDDVVWFGASFWGNCVCISQQWLGRAKKLNDWLWPIKNAVFLRCLFHFNFNCLFGQDWLLGSQVINWSQKIGKLMRKPR